VAGTTAHFNERLDVALLDLSELLKERHQHHGNAVFEPEAVFSSTTPRERICVMLDYKLSRYKQGGSELRGENLNDMLGYLLLLKMME
jgi:hypothetical protein